VLGGGNTDNEITLNRVFYRGSKISDQDIDIVGAMPTIEWNLDFLLASLWQPGFTNDGVTARDPTMFCDYQITTLNTDQI
jgi:hypothetical protein